MIKARRKSKVPLMRRASRVFLNDLNPGKTSTLTEFLRLCHDGLQYFVDLSWQRQDFSAELADLQTIHRGRDRFGLTTRLAQALAKQAKESVRAARGKRKPRIRRHTVTLYSHFVEVEPFKGSFDLALKFVGSGAPKMVVPVHSTKHLNGLLQKGFRVGKTIRLGCQGGRIFVDFVLEKARPEPKKEGRVLGLDSNYKNGWVASDGQKVADAAYEIIRALGKRRKHTHETVRSIVFAALKKLDLSTVRMLVIENLKNVRNGTRGKFPRRLNRRLSHWLYNSVAEWLDGRCEELGVRLERKNPWKTSQFCRLCRRWDRRNRRGDEFRCVHCGHSEHADSNAASNLELLGLAGAYGLRLLQSQSCGQNVAV